LAALEHIWSQLGEALETANKALARANAATRALPDHAEIAQAKPQSVDMEGGMVELAVDSAFAAVTASPKLATPDPGALTIEAGVALFQAFELGTGPGANDGSPETADAGLEGLPEGSAAVDESDETLDQRAALSAGAVLTVLPFALRCKGSEQEQKQSRRLTRVFRWLDIVVGRVLERRSRD
jgi:hypothetical protein